MASSFGVELNCGAVNESMGCLDDKLLSEVYSASIDLGLELAFGDSSG